MRGDSENDQRLQHVVCEGVEKLAERDVLDSLGADLLQGYLFAPPARAFPKVHW